MTLTPLDILSIIGLTADGISVWRAKRIKESREIYLSEVRDGVFANIDEDDIISISHRLWRAISEGMAKNNFRLLCRLIQGLGDNKKLSAPTFLRFASILDSLTDDEIYELASAIKKYKPKEPVNVDEETGQALLRTGLLRMDITTHTAIEEETDYKVLMEGGSKYKTSYEETETAFYFTGLMSELMQYVDFCINHDKENKL